MDKDKYRVFWSEEGKRRSKVVDGSRGDAEAYLAGVYGGKLPPGTTWDQFWKAKVVPSMDELAERTRHDYNWLWDTYLQPVIGSEAVRDMDWERANEVVATVDAPSTQRYCGRLLKKVCRMAVRDKAHLLKSNPVVAMTYKPLKHRPKHIVEAPDVAAFLAAIEGSKYEPILLALLGAGLRPEEADALLWEDVSEYRLAGRAYCAIRVERALTVVGGKRILKDAKNTGSERTAVVGEPFASRLLALADGKSGPLCEGRYRRGDEVNVSWFTSPATITRNFGTWCKAAGRRFPYTCQEHMRSSYATLAAEAMVPDSVVEANMGHVGSTVKARHYQQATMRSKCMAADMIAEYLEGFGVCDRVQT